MFVQNTTPSQPGTSSQPTAQPEEFSEFYKGYRHFGAGKSNSSTYYKYIS